MCDSLVNQGDILDYFGTIFCLLLPSFTLTNQVFDAVVFNYFQNREIDRGRALI